MHYIYIILIPVCIHLITGVYMMINRTYKCCVDDLLKKDEFLYILEKGLLSKSRNVNVSLCFVNFFTTFFSVKPSFKKVH